VRDWRAGLVAVLSAWELVAILTGRLPTITWVWHQLRGHRLARIGTWLALGWLIEHLFAEGLRAELEEMEEFTDAVT
jgi:hypothetical protein